MMNKKISIITLAAFTLVLISLQTALGAHVNVQGYVFFHNGTKVPVGTDVILNQTATGWDGVTTTGGPDTNFYSFNLVAASDDGNDVMRVFSWYGVYNGSAQDNGLGTIYINITYDNIVPRWNATLLDQSMDEDDPDGIDDAIDLAAYAWDFDGSPLTFSVSSQSNSGLVSASIDGDYLDIAAPSADDFGTSDVCIRANDGEDYSSEECITITVNSQPDPPTFSSATDNVTGMIKGGTAVQITTSASDVDGDTLLLYVCNTDRVDATGCIDTERCSDTGASNPSCIFTSETDDAEHSWYAFLYDSTGRIASSNYTQNYTTDGNAPVPGTVLIEGGDDYLAATSITFLWSGFSDGLSGIRYYYYNFTDNSGSRTQTRVDNETTIGALSNPSEGNNTVYVWAEDRVGNINGAATDWIWIDNYAPAFSNWDQTPDDLREGYTGAFTVSVTISDITWNSSDPPEFRYRIGSGSWSSWADMTSSGGMVYELSVTREWALYSSQRLYYEVRAYDRIGNTNTTQRSEMIDIQNYEPSLDSISDMTATEGTNFSFTISATDLDNDTITFSSDYNFSFVQLTNDRAKAWWVPPNDAVGDNQVTFYATDGYSNDSATVNIYVQAVNNPPVLSAVGNLKSYYRIPFVHYLYATDADNQNEYILDNNLLLFDLTQNYNWFRIDSYFNVSNASYYGAINFTPLASQKGRWNITVYVTDGSAIDAENITFTVGYCGDFDAGGEPWCDADFESCQTCPEDCGPCSDDEANHMTIIIDPRNCLGRNFTIWTYKLYDRATCPDQGEIVQGKEVCGNLSGVKIDVYMLENRRWEKVDEYLSDDNGMITFVPVAEGEYKLVGTKKDYPKTYEYLEIRPCIEDEKEEQEQKPKTEKNETKEPTEDRPQEVEEEEQEPEGETVEQASTMSIIITYVGIPAIVIILVILGYYYYDKNKDKKAWILKTRIWLVQKKKLIKAKVMQLWQKIRSKKRSS